MEHGQALELRDRCHDEIRNRHRPVLAPRNELVLDLAGPCLRADGQKHEVQQVEHLARPR